VRGGKERSQKVRKVREQEGSEGCRVAQEREAMRGWAPEVMGAMAVREEGRMSSLVGKRVGEMKALWVELVGICVCVGEEEEDSRPVKPRHLGETIDDFAGLGPL
jgi:hypothetical protein